MGFLLCYAAWGLACPFALAAVVAVVFELMHQRLGWLLGVFVVIMLAIACATCLLSWAIMLGLHMSARWQENRGVRRQVNENA